MASGAREAIGPLSALLVESGRGDAALGAELALELTAGEPAGSSSGNTLRRLDRA